MTRVKSDKLQLIGNAKEAAFLYGGFCNWKDATRCFNKHEMSNLHKTAVDVVVTVPNTCGDVGIMLSSAHASAYVFKIVQNIQFMPRQGIALRGDGDEKDSNFMQLLLLHSSDDLKLYLSYKRKEINTPVLNTE